MVDTLIAFIRYFLAALKRLGQAAVVIVLLLLLLRVLETKPHPSVAAFTEWVTDFANWFGGVLLNVAVFFLDPWHALIAIAIALPLYHYIFSFNDAVGSKVSALKAAAFDLVRLMETTTDGNDAKATKLNDIVYRFAVEGPSKIAESFGGGLATTAPKPASDEAGGSKTMGGYSYSPCAQVVIPDLTQKAYDLMERRLGDMTSFGGNCGNLRTGLMVFLLIVEHGNIGSAYAHLIEHMKKQRDDAKKSLPNFIDLKRFFGLSTTWPKDNDPEDAAAKGLSWYDYLVFEAALSDKNKKKIYDIMVYHPLPDGKEDITISGEKVLKSMRHYLRAWKNYDANLADAKESMPAAAE